MQYIQFHSKIVKYFLVGNIYIPYKELQSTCSIAMRLYGYASVEMPSNKLATLFYIYFDISALSTEWIIKFSESKCIDNRGNVFL